MEFHSSRYMRSGSRTALRQHPTIVARRCRSRATPAACGPASASAPFSLPLVCCSSSKLRPEGQTPAPGGCASFAGSERCARIWLEWEGAWCYDEFPCGYRSLVVNSGSSDWISIFEREQCERHKSCRAPAPQPQAEAQGGDPAAPSVPPKELGETLVGFSELPFEERGPHSGYRCELCGAEAATWTAAFRHAAAHVRCADDDERAELFAHCISSAETYRFRLLSHAWHALPEQLQGEDAVILPVASLHRFADWIHAGLCCLPLDSSPVVDIVYGPGEEPLWFEWLLP